MSYYEGVATMEDNADVPEAEVAGYDIGFFFCHFSTHRRYGWLDNGSMRGQCAAVS